MQHDDTVATVGRRNRIGVRTFLAEEPLGLRIVPMVQVETSFCAFTDRVIHMRQVFLMVAYY